jgi:heme-degrading monooxygenase HmoA
MFVIVWQFEVTEENQARFEAAYGPQGSWAQLFRSSSDYHGTELLRDAYVPLTYLTIDHWASEDAFRAFRKDQDAAYEQLDRECDALTAKETRIGAVTTA